MKVNEKVIRTYQAEDGKVFTDKQECWNYEMEESKKKVGPSIKYVIGVAVREKGKIVRGSFKKFNTGRRRNAPGYTSSLKYATKFSTFEEAYSSLKNAGYYTSYDDILTLETAYEVEDFLSDQRAREAVREQRYVMAFTDEKTPAEGGEYITDLGLVHYVIDGKKHFWGSRHTPKFWMQKINKTAR